MWVVGALQMIDAIALLRIGWAEPIGGVKPVSKQEELWKPFCTTSGSVAAC